MPDDHAQRIVAALRQASWPRSVSVLAQATGLKASLVAKALDRLSDQGVVQRVEARGLYGLPDADN